jgi:hypothetical protein
MMMDERLGQLQYWYLGIKASSTSLMLSSPSTHQALVYQYSQAMLSPIQQRAQTPFHYDKVPPLLRRSFVSSLHSLGDAPAGPDIRQDAMRSVDTLSLLSISISRVTCFDQQLSVKSFESLVLHYGEASESGMHKALPSSLRHQLQHETHVSDQLRIQRDDQQTGALKQWLGTLKLRAKTLLMRKSSHNKENEQTKPSKQVSSPRKPHARPPLAPLFNNSLSSVNNPFEDHDTDSSKIWRDSEGNRYVCIQQLFPTKQQLDAFWQLRMEAMCYGRVVPVSAQSVMQRCQQKTAAGLWTVDDQKRIWSVQRIN